MTNKPLLIDASMIKAWLDCRELFRQRYVENRAPAEPSFHQAYGSAVHLAAEAHNKGESFEDGLKLAAESLAGFPEQLLNPYKQQRFRELAAELPSVVAAYFDGVDNDNYEVVAVEQEWSHQFLPGVFLCGRKDKVMRLKDKSGYVLCDLKTASEIDPKTTLVMDLGGPEWAGNTRTWHSEFRQMMLRDFGLALYDWHEQRIGRVPSTVRVEVLVKPYKGKEPRLEVFDLPEIAVYRKRFEQQLAWVVAEIKHYFESYLTMKPWPQAQGQCMTKYGACEYLQLCNQGETAKTLVNFTERQEHLELRK